MDTSDHCRADLDGLIDMHIHTAPDIRPRYCDDLQAAREARAAGLKAILIKSHITLTADRATIAEKVVNGVRVFGGLVLNDAVGGLNPSAVAAALDMGAKEIWMPTFSAANERRQKGLSGGITIFSEGSVVRQEIHEIIDLVRQAGSILATGHISVEESLALVGAARKQGLRKIVVSHPESSITRMPVETQTEIAGDDLFFERCYVACTAAGGFAATVERIAADIKHVGVQSTILATDFGLASLPSPTEGMREYLSKMILEGFDQQAISRMAGENPAFVLDI